MVTHSSVTSSRLVGHICSAYELTQTVKDFEQPLSVQFLDDLALSTSAKEEILFSSVALFFILDFTFIRRERLP